MAFLFCYVLRLWQFGDAINDYTFKSTIFFLRCFVVMMLTFQRELKQITTCVYSCNWILKKNKNYTISTITISPSISKHIYILLLWLLFGNICCFTQELYLNVYKNKKQSTYPVQNLITSFKWVDLFVYTNSYIVADDSLWVMIRGWFNVNNIYSTANTKIVVYLLQIVFDLYPADIALFSYLLT